MYFAFVYLEKACDRVPREVVRWSLRKLGVMEWLVRMVMAMYSGSKSRVRINNVLGNKFSVKVGVYQGSVLRPLLFIIVLEALSSECKNRSMWELLYADDLVIIAESLKELEDSYCSWKNSIESKGLGVNMKKTKVMVSALYHGPIFQSGKHSCGVCFEGVGVSSIICTLCNHWVHRRCSSLKSKFASAIKFKYKACLDPQVSDVDYKAVEFDGNKYEAVNQFCYLGDMISAGSGFCCC